MTDTKTNQAKHQHRQKGAVADERHRPRERRHHERDQAARSRSEASRPAGPATRAANSGANRLTSIPTSRGTKTVQPTGTITRENERRQRDVEDQLEERQCQRHIDNRDQRGRDEQADRIGGLAAGLDILGRQKRRHRRQRQRDQRDLDRGIEIKRVGERRRDNRHDDQHRHQRSEQAPRLTKECRSIAWVRLQSQCGHEEQQTGDESCRHDEFDVQLTPFSRLEWPPRKAAQQCGPNAAVETLLLLEILETPDGRRALLVDLQDDKRSKLSIG